MSVRIKVSEIPFVDCIIIFFASKYLNGQWDNLHLIRKCVCVVLEQEKPGAFAIQIKMEWIVCA